MEFRDKPMQNLVRIPEKDICKNAQKLLLDGETVDEFVDSGSDVVTPDNAQERLDTLKTQLH